METLECSKCGERKSAGNFYKASNRKTGHQPYCKTCSTIYRRSYAKTEVGKLNQQRYDLSQKRKDAAKKTRDNNKQKRRAVAAVNHLVRKGGIPRANKLKCKRCNKKAREYHHHNGYSEAYKYDVIPLCRACHVMEHTP